MAQPSESTPRASGPAIVPPKALPPDEAAKLREEYAALEDTVQRYITIYLTGLAVLASWLLGPESISVADLLGGNGGYNHYLVMFIAVLNTIFFCYLLYTGLQIHELMQFIVTLSPPGTTMDQWEQWRRSAHSVTKPVRTIRHGLVSGIPVLMTVLLTGIALGLIDGIHHISSQPFRHWPAPARTAALTWLGVLLFAIAISFPFIRHSVRVSERKWTKIFAARSKIDFDAVVIHDRSVYEQGSGAGPVPPAPVPPAAPLPLTRSPTDDTNAG